MTLYMSMVAGCVSDGVVSQMGNMILSGRSGYQV